MLRTTYNHGAIHKASETILRLEGQKHAADVVKTSVKFPWLAKCLNSAATKLKRLFSSKTPEDEVALPSPTPMPAEEAVAFLLWKNLSIETYKQMRQMATCKVTGFTVSKLDRSF